MSHHHYEDVIDTSRKKKKIDTEIEKLQSEKEKIEKAEEIKNQKALALSEEVKDLKEKRDKLRQLIIQKNCELTKLCTHERVRTENRSYAGGYLDRAEYWTDYFCEICGVKIDEKVEYGGFG